MLNYTLESDLGARANIGLIVLATDCTLETEWRHLIDLPGVTVHTARMPAAIRPGPDGLADLADHIGPAARLLVPGLELDVIAFGCTSATTVLGERNIREILQGVRPGTPFTTPITAVLTALQGLGSGRIAMVTPYGAETNEVEVRYMREAGIEVCNLVTFGAVDDVVAARIDARTLRTAVLAAAEAKEAEAIFVSCTSLRCARLIPTLEMVVGRPVISSNQALAWHALRLSGIRESMPRQGRVFKL